MGKFIDMTEQPHGDWWVIRRDDSRPEPVAYWICRCKCGRVGSVRGQYLRDGRSPSCRKCSDQTRPSYPRYKPGKKVGNWTILRHDKKAGGYLCRCKCGYEAVRQIGNLGGGKTGGCKKCWLARHRVAVRKKRKPLTNRTLWTAEQLTLLGTDSDQAIANRLGRSENAVRQKRKKLGVPQPCSRK